MKVRYKVHTVADAKFLVKATLAGGREVDAEVPGFTYELISEDADMVHTFHVQSSEANEAAEFQPGDDVDAVFTKA